MDCMCLKRKRRHRRDQKKFRPLTPHVSPSHSQPSTLGHPPDPRLPKVASNGLWLSTPSIYSGVPSPAYYYGPNAKHIPRASSETRIPQPRQQFIPTRPHFGSHNNVYIIPVPGQRIYHSQPLAPLYEVPPTHHGSEIYDVYQFVGPGGISSNSRSKLLETRHTPGYYHDQDELRGGRRPERSKSDAQDRRHPRQDYSRQQQQQSRQPRQSSAESREISSSSRDNASSRRSAGSSQGGDQRISKSMESLKNSSGSGGPRAAPSQVHKGHVNIAYYSPEAARTRPPPTSVATSTIEVTHSFLPNGLSNTENISPSATDSMKLLAKNKTDDQKKQQPGLATIMVEKKNAENDEDRLKKENIIRHYNYADDIYTLPTKSAEDAENPILDRMKEMVIEKSRASNRASANDIPVAVTSDSGLYEVTKVTKVVKTEVTESYQTDDVVADLDLPDISQLEKTQASDLPSRNALPVNHITTTTTTSKDELSVPVSPSRDKNNVSPKLSVDADGANDAKQITSKAFEFLEDYLDDDGTDAHVDSPPLSPGGMRVEGVVS